MFFHCLFLLFLCFDFKIMYTGESRALNIDHFSTLPNELICNCINISPDYYISPSTIHKFMAHQNNIIPNNDIAEIKCIFNKIRNLPQLKGTALLLSVSLVNKRLYSLIQAAFNPHKEFLNIPFNIYSFCIDQQNERYIYDWYWHFHTGIICLQDNLSIRGYTIFKPTQNPDTDPDKSFLQNNYIRFDEKARLTIEFGRQYKNPINFSKNTLFKHLIKMSDPQSNNRLSIDNLIGLLKKLQKECYVCNSLDEPKIFSGSKECSLSKKGIPCSCLLLIKTLSLVRTLFSNDQSLKLFTVQPDQVFNFGTIYARKKLITEIQLPINAKVPLQFCFDIGLFN